MKYTTRSEKDTINLGKKIATRLRPGDIICLYGDLGAGKTTLVKGISEGFGIERNVTSPTFAIMNLLQVHNKSKIKIKNSKTPVSLIHYDLYRLKEEEEFIDIGGVDYLGAPDSICLIEWPEKIEGLLKNKKCVEIRIEHSGKKSRKFTIFNS